MADILRRLADRVEIHDALLNYVRGVDRRDWELVRATFFADATDDHADYKGPRDGFIEWVAERHAEIARSTHFLGNCNMQFASDELAVVETNFIAMMTLGPEATQHRQMLADAAEAGAAGTLDVEVLGRYVDRFEKRDGAWRVAKRRVVFDSARSRRVDDAALNPVWLLGRRDGHDPLYQALAEAGLGKKA